MELRAITTFKTTDAYMNSKFSKLVSNATEEYGKVQRKFDTKEKNIRTAPKKKANDYKD